ncbi:MAG: hypothetical protein ACJ75P_09515 [Gaiellaceae bacterium]
MFRHVNERIAEQAERFDSDETDFVCECADAGCQHRLELPLDKYDEVRQEPTQFVVADGHQLPAHERIVERRTPYLVVKKVGRALSAAVRRTDPRAETA